MSPGLFNVYTSILDAQREVNTKMLERGLELVRANSGRFEINQLLFAVDTVLYSGRLRRSLV